MSTIDLSENTVVRTTFTLRAWVAMGGLAVTVIVAVFGGLWKAGEWANEVKGDVASLRESSDRRMTALEAYDKDNDRIRAERIALRDAQIEALRLRQASIETAITRIDTNIDWLRREQEQANKREDK